MKMAEWLNLDARKKRLHEPHKPGHPKFIFRILWQADRNLYPGLIRWQASVNKKKCWFVVALTTPQNHHPHQFLFLFLCLFFLRKKLLIPHLNCTNPLLNLRRREKNNRFMKDGPGKNDYIVVNFITIN